MAATFPVLDLIQRVVVAGLIRLRPRWRDRILSAWIRGLARWCLYGLVGRIAGARLPRLPAIPSDPGVLLLMNHQSLIDIPMAVLSIADRHPQIVTRRRYASHIPVVSHMLRLYDFPLVDPGSIRSEGLEVLADRVARADRPTVIFPEGGRTRDGEIRPFRRAGLATMLPKRTWNVYVLVIDGFWKCARLTEFIEGVGHIRGDARWAGPFQYSGGEEGTGEFIDRMRDLMREQLAEMRGADDVRG
jgi:1-acyl-sn-glycerol-3-phosphate acyltransferase